MADVHHYGFSTDDVKQESDLLDHKITVAVVTVVVATISFTSNNSSY
jgi:hypothetical protein